MKNLTPTDEQLDIIEAATTMSSDKILKISAFAGAAKTTTLAMITKSMPKQRFLYLAFNKAIVEDSKGIFDYNTKIMTTHSLAFRYALRDRAIRGNYKAIEIAKKFKTNYTQASRALKIVDLFFNSDLDSIEDVAFEMLDIEMSDLRDINDFYSSRRVAIKIIDAMSSGEIEITHSCYLKEFEMMLKSGFSLNLEVDYILLDEAQDTNPVTLSIFAHLGGRKIVVGDKHQQIYGFRDSLNAMDKLDGDELKLSVTFRSTQSIVDKANWILNRFKNEQIKIVSGNQNEPIFKTYAYISRTNAQLIKYIAKHEKFNLTRTPEDLFESALSLYYWSNAEHDSIKNRYKYLREFTDVDELNNYIDIAHDYELKVALDVAKEYKDDLLNLYEKAKSNYSRGSRANLTLTTAHSAKGLEFDKVQLADDFAYLIDSISDISPDIKTLHQMDTHESRATIEEINLYYVACTRAKFELQDKTPNATMESMSRDSIDKLIEHHYSNKFKSKI